MTTPPMTDKDLKTLSERGRSRADLLDQAPINSLAPSLSGGCWMKTARGWHWNGHVSNGGGCFPSVGADWDDSIILPLTDGSPRVAWRPSDRVVRKFDAYRSGHLIPSDGRVEELELRQCLHNMTAFAKRVMELLEKHGAGIVPHLLDTDDNSGQFLRVEIGVAEKLLSDSALQKGQS